MSAPATTPRERPILFSGPMVRAILAGSKTQTRRAVGLDTLRPSDTPGYDWTWRGQAPIRSIARQRRHPQGCWQDVSHADLLALCPYGVPGDRLWVRETWAKGWTWLGEQRCVFYRADGAGMTGSEYRPVCPGDTPAASAPDGIKWRPSIFMSRWASRLTLDVVSVRVERLHDIGEKDILAEGVTVPIASKMTGIPWDEIPDLFTAWRLAWTHIYGAESWDADPWVWAIEFRKVNE